MYPPEEPHGTMDISKKNGVQVVTDAVEYQPTFQNICYGALEYELHQIYIMMFVVFERMFSGNTMLAILIVAVVDLILYEVRTRRAQKNLSDQSFVDDIFLN